MSRVLNGFTGLFDSSRLLDVSLALALVLTLLGLAHHSDAFAWVLLAGFIATAFATASAVTHLDQEPLFWIFFGGLAVGIQTNLSSRFPGLHLGWLYVMLAGASLVFLLVGDADKEKAGYSRRCNAPKYVRFLRTTVWAIATLTVGLAAIYHDTAIILPIIVVDVLLALLYVVLQAQKSQKYGVPVRT